MKNDVFISYSRKDSEIADKIYDIFKDCGVSCFIDRLDISGGEEFSPVLAEQIENSTVFLFLGSGNSYTAKWTPKELHYALNHKDNRAIIPYIIDDTPIPMGIEIGISDLNIRNIKDHPIETVLLDDVKKAKELFAPKNGKEDLNMVKAIIERILSSSHNIEYNIRLLTELGNFNWPRVNGRMRAESRPKEAREYYNKVLDLSNSLKTRKEGDNAFIYNQLADIELDLNNLPKAEELYNSAINSYKQKASSRFRFDCFDCILNLAEIQVSEGKIELAEASCSEAKSMVSSFGSQWGIVERVCRLEELYENILRKLERTDEAEKIYDDLLEALRSKSSEPGDSFSELLYSFAQSNIKLKNFGKAKEYLEEALLIDKENTDLLLALADTYVAQNNHQEALKTYDKAYNIAIKSDLSERRSRNYSLENIVTSVANYFNARGEKDRVEYYYQIAISKFTIVSFEQSTYNTRIGGIFEPYADWLFEQKRYNDALLYYKKCLSANEYIQNPNRAAHNKARVHNKRAAVYFLLNLKDSASEEMRIAIDSYNELKNDSLITQALYEMIKHLKSLNYDEGAKMLTNYMMSNYEENMPTKEEDITSYATGFGWYLLLLGEYGLAKQPLEQALSFARYESSIANSKNNLGRLYAVTEEHDKAEDLLNDALRYFKNASINNQEDLGGYAESLSYLGLLRLRQNKYYEAVNFLEKSLETYKRYSTLVSDRRNSDAEETSLWLEEAKARI